MMEADDPDGEEVDWEARCRQVFTARRRMQNVRTKLPPEDSRALFADTVVKGECNQPQVCDDGYSIDLWQHLFIAAHHYVCSIYDINGSIRSVLFSRHSAHTTSLIGSSVHDPVRTFRAADSHKEIICVAFRPVVQGLQVVLLASDPLLQGHPSLETFDVETGCQVFRADLADLNTLYVSNCRVSANGRW